MLAWRNYYARTLGRCAGNASSSGCRHSEREPDNREKEVQRDGGVICKYRVGCPVTHRFTQRAKLRFGRALSTAKPVASAGDYFLSRSDFFQNVRPTSVS